MLHNFNESKRFSEADWEAFPTLFANAARQAVDATAPVPLPLSVLAEATAPYRPRVGPFARALIECIALVDDLAVVDACVVRVPPVLPSPCLDVLPGSGQFSPVPGRGKTESALDSNYKPATVASSSAFAKAIHEYLRMRPNSEALLSNIGNDVRVRLQGISSLEVALTKVPGVSLYRNSCGQPLAKLSSHSELDAVNLSTTNVRPQALPARVPETASLPRPSASRSMAASPASRAVVIDRAAAAHVGLRDADAFAEALCAAISKAGGRLDLVKISHLSRAQWHFTSLKAAAVACGFDVVYEATGKGAIYVQLPT